MKRIIFHIDVNNAFLSWSAVFLLKKNVVDIRKIPAVIGGSKDSRHGIVLAKSPLAKAKGVVTGEPISLAQRKCPNLQVFPPNYNLYSEMSYRLFKLVSNYTPDVEICSIDECYLDYTPVKKLYGDEVLFARKLQKEIFQKLGFTVNIGIANNKLCAKMASDLEKPNKIITIYDEEIRAKLFHLPVGQLFGVGKKTKEVLNKIEILTIADLADADPKKLTKYFKNRAGQLINMAQGIDESPVVVDRGGNKGISSSETFAVDYFDRYKLRLKLDFLTEKVAYQLRQQNAKAFVVGIVIKDAFFKTKSQQKKLKNATNDTFEMQEIVRKLFDDAWDEKAVRLLGVKVEKLTLDDSYQISLFEDTDRKEKDIRLNQTIDQLYQKYGSKIIKKGGN